jgi:lipoyl(octanoyl) transferase
VDGPLPGVENMARDHAMALEAQDGGVLRWYGWDAPTISFGRNEPVPAAVAQRAGESGFPALVRRPTGGRAVLHDQELTYALVVPHRGGMGPRQVYARVHEGIVAGFRALGIPAALVERGRVLPPHAGPCFQAAAPGEVALDGRKLVGSAQARIAGAILQHGSILLGGDQARLDGLLGRAPGDRAATLADLPDGPPPLDLLRRALSKGIVEALGGNWESAGPTDGERVRTADLHAHYLDPAWTWRC